MFEASSRRLGSRGAALLIATAALAGCNNADQQSKSEAPAPQSAAPATAPAPLPIAAPIQKEIGHAWIVVTDVNPAERKLRVFENDRELGPGDAIHDEIRQNGLGAYSHWNTGPQGFVVYFSTSDNSDPNTNGRTYTLR